jgi:protein SCO1/2
MHRRDFFSGIAAAVAVPAVGLTLGTNNATADVVRAVGMGSKNIPNVPVTNQDGRKYRFYGDLVQGKTVLINFFYAKCTGICPLMTSNLSKISHLLGDRVGRDIFIYSISLKPEQDTTKNLKQYARMHGTGEGWMLLRAARPDMELLRERLGFKDSDPVLDKDIDQHTGILRFGSDVYDRWSAYPLMGRVQTIAELVNQLDPTAPKKSLY